MLFILFIYSISFVNGCNVIWNFDTMGKTELLEGVTCPGGFCNQVPGRIYQVGSQCWLALSYCSSCLDNPTESQHLTLVDCDPCPDCSSCGNGNICAGEETCITTDQPYCKPSGPRVDCSTWSTPKPRGCDALTGSCLVGIPTTTTPPNTRDCSVLAIDEFLLQCSAEFPAQQTTVTDLESRVTTIETNLQAQVTQNTNDIADLQTSISTDNTDTATQIQQIQSDIDNVNSRIDMFAAHAPVLSFDNGNNNVFGMHLKDLFIILCLIGNLIIMTGVYCYKRNNGNKKKQVYDGIVVDSDVEN